MNSDLTFITNEKEQNLKKVWNSKFFEMQYLYKLNKIS